MKKPNRCPDAGSLPGLWEWASADHEKCLGCSMPWLLSSGPTFRVGWKGLDQYMKYSCATTSWPFSLKHGELGWCRRQTSAFGYAAVPRTHHALNSWWCSLEASRFFSCAIGQQITFAYLFYHLLPSFLPIKMQHVGEFLDLAGTVRWSQWQQAATQPPLGAVRGWNGIPTARWCCPQLR